ncbi:hypothetical protein KIS4809_0708 [Bacillus sp. ZZV12-4809]|nr:hypothetical protein KIS4809_0708 [Bacillus sp. ZZV12-4809]
MYNDKIKKRKRACLDSQKAGSASSWKSEILQRAVRGKRIKLWPPERRP